MLYECSLFLGKGTAENAEADGREGKLTGEIKQSRGTTAT
jgi:hypothetical protein